MYYKLSRLSLALAALAAAPLAAHASLQLNAQFTEGSTANSNPETTTDYWSLSILGSGAGYTIQSVTFTLPPSVQAGAVNGIYFDLVPGDSIGFDNAGPYTPTASSGLTGVPSATFQNNPVGTPPTSKPNTLSLDFSAAGFGDVGDVFNFTLDVDNDNSVVRGYDLLGIYDNLRHTQVDVVYSYGAATGLLASFELNTREGQEVTFAGGNWYTGVSGNVTLAAVPEAGALAVWSMLSGVGLVAAGRRRRGAVEA